MPILFVITKPFPLSLSYALVLFLASYLPQYISQIVGVPSYKNNKNKYNCSTFVSIMSIFILPITNARSEHEPKDPIGDIKKYRKGRK